MQRFVLLAAVASGQCTRVPATHATLPTTPTCATFSSTAAVALDSAKIPASGVCAPVCKDADKTVPKAATTALYTCSGTTDVANFECVEGCPSQGPVTAADLTQSLTQGYCGSAAAATNWVAKDASCTNQCTKASSVAWPKTTKCAAAGMLEKYRCVLQTDCIIKNKSTEAAAKAAKNCDTDASETYDSANGGSVIAKDKKCTLQCPDNYKVKGDTTEITCGTETDYGSDQAKINEFECEKDDSDTGSASSVSLAVSVLAVMKAAFA